VPKQRYFDFLDQSQSARVLAEGIREAYSDLFNVNKNAQTLSVDEVKNKLRTLTLGQKSDNVVSLMANTFKALSDLADWKATPPAGAPAHASVTEKKPEGAAEAMQPPAIVPPSLDAGNRPLQLHYDIQIHLPESRDAAVFDAIFAALRKHLP
jgi:hypothetical protein